MKVRELEGTREEGCLSPHLSVSAVSHPVTAWVSVSGGVRLRGCLSRGCLCPWVSVFVGVRLRGCPSPGVSVFVGVCLRVSVSWVSVSMGVPAHECLSPGVTVCVFVRPMGICLCVCPVCACLHGYLSESAYVHVHLSSRVSVHACLFPCMSTR